MAGFAKLARDSQAALRPKRLVDSSAVRLGESPLNEVQQEPEEKSIRTMTSPNPTSPDTKAGLLPTTASPLRDVFQVADQFRVRVCAQLMQIHALPLAVERHAEAHHAIEHPV